MTVIDPCVLLYLTKDKFRLFLNVAPEIRVLLNKRLSTLMVADAVMAPITGDDVANAAEEHRRASMSHFDVGAAQAQLKANKAGVAGGDVTQAEAETEALTAANTSANALVSVESDTKTEFPIQVAPLQTAQPEIKIDPVADIPPIAVISPVALVQVVEQPVQNSVVASNEAVHSSFLPGAVHISSANPADDSSHMIPEQRV